MPDSDPRAASNKAAVAEYTVFANRQTTPRQAPAGVARSDPITAWAYPPALVRRRPPHRPGRRCLLDRHMLASRCTRARRPLERRAIILCMWQIAIETIWQIRVGGKESAERDHIRVAPLENRLRARLVNT